MSTVPHADTATVCAGTPEVQVRDNRGLTVRTLQYNRSEAEQPADECVTCHRFTAAGHLSSSIDPRLFASRLLNDAVLPNFRYISSLSGRLLHTLSQDAGLHVVVFDIEGARAWRKDGFARVQSWTRDLLHRPVELREKDEAGTVRISERFVYGEAGTAPAVDNARGQRVRHYDTAGLNETPSFDISGKALRSVRRLFIDPAARSDWADNEPRRQPALQTVAYESRSSYNALGKVQRSIDAMGNVQQQVYNVAGQIAGSSLTMKDQSAEPILRDITYGAAGHVLSEIAGNGVVTHCNYEAQTRRLSALRTTRPARTGRPALLQDLRYTHDPVGNIQSINDVADPTRFHDNQRVEATCAYSYDALYQLRSATGRESAYGGALTRDLPSPIPLEGDPSLLSNYTRRYTYDRGGNLTQLRHQGRTSYTSEMLVSPTSNHAVQLTGSLRVADVEGHFDACGNLQRLGPGQALSWDERNQLRCATQVHRPDGPDDDETYQYDGTGLRLSKTTTRIINGTTRTAEVSYLPGIEIRRTLSGAAVVEELHVVTLVAAGRQAVRVLHWKSGKPAGISNDQMRCGLGDQIGSSLIELDRDADILTLEAYYPYGGTCIWSGRNDIETKYKFMRYSGKERDVTGLYYHGARYGVPWMQRWLNPDPSGTVDGLNLLCMVRNNPVNWVDSTGTNRTRPYASLGRTFKFGDVLYGLDYPRFVATNTIKQHGYQHIEPNRGILGWVRSFFGGQRKNLITQSELTDSVWNFRKPTGYSADRDISRKITNPQRGVAFREFLEKHPKYNVAATPEAARVAESEYSTEIDLLIIGLWKKTSKAGLEYQIKQRKGTVHFVVEDLVDSIEAIAGKTGKHGQSITASELRWLYRHKDAESVKNQVRFWTSDGEVKHADVFDLPGWEGYRPKHRYGASWEAGR